MTVYPLPGGIFKTIDPYSYGGEMIIDGDAGDNKGSDQVPRFTKSLSFSVTNGSQSVSTAMSVSGTRSLKIDATSTGDVDYGNLSFATASNENNLWDSIPYRLKFWIYIPSSTSWTGNLRITTSGPTNGEQTFYNQAIATDKWVEVSCVITYEGDETTIFTISLEAGHVDDYYYIDDMSLMVRYMNLGVEEIANPDCGVSTGTFPTINGYVLQAGYGSENIYSNEVRSSPYSFESSMEPNPPSSMYVRFTCNFDQSGLDEGFYMCGAWCYLPSSENFDMDNIGWYNYNPTSYDAGLGHTYPEDEWFYMEQVCHIASNGSRVWGLQFYQPTETGATLYVDDITMKKISFT